MNNITKLILSMSANLFGGIIKKNINERYENNMFSYQLYNAVVSFFSAIVLLIMSDNLNVSVFTVFFGILFGIITLVQQITNLYALENGPFSYTTVIISLSTLIPTLSGAVFWKEKIYPIQIIGIILLIICFCLSTGKGDSTVKSPKKWFLFSVLAFITTGLIGVMQKIHQSSSHKSELDAFLIIAFSVSFVFSGIYAYFVRKTRIPEKESTGKSVFTVLPVILMAISGVFVAINNKFNLYLSGVMDSAVFFPVVNGGGLVLTSFAAVIIFKEKLTVKQWFGIAVGIVSVVFLCNPF